jgi:preprotein translocase subunit YajC
MFVSPAFAQATGGGAGTGGWEALLPLVLIFVVFYFLLIRPQQKKMKLHKEMLSAIRRGDRVVTGGGILATVTKVVDDNEVMVEIADGVRVRVQRSTIAGVVSRTEPAGDGGQPGKPAEGQAPPPASAGGSILDKILGRK